ncbi:putative serine/threonine-protein kinase [Sesbania bispinosa]|nr:putative serine/threonine-protein kinase [Sesbania bispinosa]
MRIVPLPLIGTNCVPCDYALTTSMSVVAAINNNPTAAALLVILQTNLTTSTSAAISRLSKASLNTSIIMISLVQVRAAFFIDLILSLSVAAFFRSERYCVVFKCT